ncbi:MAG: TM2 domain-containing protein [Algibacter sp.]|uniref:TM2 domain-containing protein n=1 Tax=Algibacter sp. TaxID=1872428 RepID=UPI00260DD402|nr:TM2 domain-containing protein [Algibacter sp.]MDG1729399.1 TM2 domain-containing protein [Algibacter sp.]MDG2178611.1 TM2 domain-containing protein [Algibacter sp.]
MKIKLLLSFMVVLLSYSTCYASFPVKRTSTAETTATNTQVTLSETSDEVYTPLAVVKAKDKWVGAALWFLLGWPFAAHRWYYNKPVWANILFILTIGGLGIWAIIDIINILTDKWD